LFYKIKEKIFSCWSWKIDPAIIMDNDWLSVYNNPAERTNPIKYELPKLDLRNSLTKGLPWIAAPQMGNLELFHVAAYGPPQFIVIFSNKNIFIHIEFHHVNILSVLSTGKY